MHHQIFSELLATLPPYHTIPISLVILLTVENSKNGEEEVDDIKV